MGYVAVNMLITEVRKIFLNAPSHVLKLREK